MPPKPKVLSTSAAAHARPSAATTSSPSSDPAPKQLTSSPPALDSVSEDFKTELLTSLREEVVNVFRAELAMAMSDNLSKIKAELRDVKAELNVSIAAVSTEVGELKKTVRDMEGSLSTCTDDVVSLQSKVERLVNQVTALENKCDNLESRSRRQNIRIVGYSEQNGAINANTVSIMLIEAFGLDKPPLIDRAHRSPPQPLPGGRPRPIIARLHYYADCVDILRRARAQQRIKMGEEVISVFPDYTSSTSRARAAFNDVRRQLKVIPDIRFGIVHPARLRITSNGITREFTSPGEANVFVKTLL
ncbi:unnamed protein product [Knipowitschia caucasica]|uniref:Transposase element L1Md-A101/L1Md-A102/L1Md-A2 n=1 Tax=Knipowitschia caucasica TaxID=637954 RepID=A0AAV2MQI2_KNICA